MSVAYRFICDGCGKDGEGVPGQYVHPDPPMGWTWRFGPGLDGPHACSDECWAKVYRAPDGRAYLPCSHERNTWTQALTPRPQAPVPPPPAPRKKKPGRPVKRDSLTDLARRVEAIEANLPTANKGAGR